MDLRVLREICAIFCKETTPRSSEVQLSRSSKHQYPYGTLLINQNLRMSLGKQSIVTE